MSLDGKIYETKPPRHGRTTVKAYLEESGKMEVVTVTFPTGWATRLPERPYLRIDTFDKTKPVDACDEVPEYLKPRPRRTRENVLGPHCIED